MNNQNSHIGRRIQRSDAFHEPTELNAIAENADLKEQRKQDRRRIKMLTEERRRLKATANGLREKVGALEDELEQAQERIEELEHEVEYYDKALTDAQRRHPGR